ncbi:MAG: hypothetical protein RL346_1694 [Verrucomicrobiota bacterium]
MKTHSDASTPTPELSGLRGSGVNWGMLLSVGTTLLLLIWFYCYETRYGPGHIRSTLGWLTSTWTPVTDYEHGKLVPIVILGLIVYRFKDVQKVVGQGSPWGLLVILFGGLLYLAAYRTYQPRFAVGSLPFVVWGAILYLWGWRVAKILSFPVFFILISIPLPSFQQATTHLQLLATSLAHYGSGLFGVETYTKGTLVLPVQGDWKPLSIAHGCSGIRSLMALLMISAAWAFVANFSLWKRAILFLSAIPLAILGNALRIISIFLIAEHGNATWAITTWHDWSGLLLFYPFSMFLLLVIHSVLEGGLPWKRGKRRVIRRTTVRQAAEGEGGTAG